VVSPNPGLLAAFLKTGRLGGVVRWKVVLDVDTVTKECEAAGWRSLALNSQGAKSLEDFLQICATELNLDKSAAASLATWEQAVGELLIQEVPTCVMWMGWQDLIRASPADASVVASIFEDILKDHPGLVLIAGHQGNFPKVDELALA